MADPGRTKPIYVIVDGHPARKGKVKAFVERNKKWLKEFVLPPYSPQLNPDALVWADLKHHTIGKRAFHVVGQLWEMSRASTWSGCARLVSSFFDEPHVRYAKA